MFGAPIEKFLNATEDKTADDVLAEMKPEDVKILKNEYNNKRNNDVEEEDDTDKEEDDKVEEEDVDTDKEEENSKAEEMSVEGFRSRFDYGTRFLSLDLFLRSLLYACLFFVVSHNDMANTLKRVARRVPRNMVQFVPMAIFGLLYYLINMFV